MAFCRKGRPFHPGSAWASCLLTPSHRGSQEQSSLALGNPLHGSKPQFINFKAELIVHLLCKVDRAYMIKAGEIQ